MNWLISFVDSYQQFVYIVLIFVLVQYIKSSSHRRHYVLLSLFTQGSHRPEKYLNLEGFLEKSLKDKFALKSTGKSFKSLEKSLNSTIFYRT